MGNQMHRRSNTLQMTTRSTSRKVSIGNMDWILFACKISISRRKLYALYTQLPTRELRRSNQYWIANCSHCNRHMRGAAWSLETGWRQLNVFARCSTHAQVGCRYVSSRWKPYCNYIAWQLFAWLTGALTPSLTVYALLHPSPRLFPTPLSLPQLFRQIRVCTSISCLVVIMWRFIH